MNETISLGSRIRQYRKSLRLNLVQFAERCSISPSFLSQIERDLANPSVGTLYAIADVLGIPIAALVGEPGSAGAPDQQAEPKTTTVVRANGRKVIIYPGSGIRNELLTPNFQRSIQMMRVVMPPGTDSGDVPFSHDGEECGIILQGTLETWVGDERYILGPGDAICHDSTIPHRNRNIGDVDVIMVVAKTPPSIDI